MCLIIDRKSMKNRRGHLATCWSIINFSRNSVMLIHSYQFSWRVRHRHILKQWTQRTSRWVKRMWGPLSRRGGGLWLSLESPQGIRSSLHLVRWNMSLHLSHCREIEVPYVFDWEHGTAQHEMQGNRASHCVEGEVSWVFSSCGRHVGYILELRRGCPF